MLHRLIFKIIIDDFRFCKISQRQLILFFFFKHILGQIQHVGTYPGFNECHGLLAITVIK